MKVPLFPLSTAVLFPRVFMPLHIFEPRYRAMLADALQGSKRIAMGLLSPREGEVHGICGVGLIVRHESLPDGRSNIMLLGEIRARILTQEKTGPYLTARVERLAEVAPETAPGRAALQRLEAFLREAFRTRFHGEGERLLAQLLKQGLDPGALADFAASVLLPDPLARQGILETLDVLQRVERLCTLVSAKTRRAAWAGEPSGILLN